MQQKKQIKIVINLRYLAIVILTLWVGYLLVTR